MKPSRRGRAQPKCHPCECTLRKNFSKVLKSVSKKLIGAALDKGSVCFSSFSRFGPEPRPPSPTSPTSSPKTVGSSDKEFFLSSLKHHSPGRVVHSSCISLIRRQYRKYTTQNRRDGQTNTIIKRKSDKVSFYRFLCPSVFESFLTSTPNPGPQVQPARSRPRARNNKLARKKK